MIRTISYAAPLFVAFFLALSSSALCQQTEAIESMCLPPPPPPTCPTDQVRDRHGQCCYEKDLSPCDQLCNGAQQQARPILLDAFGYTSSNLQGQQDSLRSSEVGHAVTLVQDFAGAYGGTRSIEYIPFGSASGAASFRPGYGQVPSLFEVANSLLGASSAFLVYDGDTIPGLTNYRGLCKQQCSCHQSSCLDITRGGATELQLAVFYDWPFRDSSSDLDLVFTFYDASDPSGNTYSRGTFTLGKRFDSVPLEYISLPFSGLYESGPNGSADLTNIGAFSIFVDGARQFSADLALSDFRTNGLEYSCPAASSTHKTCRRLKTYRRRSK